MGNLLFLGSEDHPEVTNQNVRVLTLREGDLLFSDPRDVPYLALLDLSHDRCLDYITALREFFSPELCVIWGFGESPTRERGSLFFALGGDRTGDLSGLWEEAQLIPEDERDLTPLDYPLRLCLKEKESIQRLMAGLQCSQMQMELVEIPLITGLFDQTVEKFFQVLEEICHPHISILLLNAHLTVESYVKPADWLFREDCLNFRSFCLSDFFQYFRGVDLENPREILFLGDRTDFDKISMGRQKISSYLCFPLKDSMGRVLATFHLGHGSNDYFTPRMRKTIREMIVHMAIPFSYAFHTDQTILRQERIFQIFSRFVPPDIIPQLVDQEKTKSQIKPAKREVAVLFCDIRAFTSISESNGAQQVVEFLNRHFDAMVGAIEEEGGSIGQFIGDAIVAFFGVPNPLENSSRSALKAAMYMVRNLVLVDISGLILPESGYSIGVGLHIGEAIVGNIGSLEKSDYTAIGDVVGIAEELEALTKSYPGHILGSQTLYDAVREAVPMQNVGRMEGGLNVYLPVWEDTEGGL